ncbi:MAG: hypothetical protein ABJA81_05195 [Nocardioidaceae bacterium]
MTQAPARDNHSAKGRPEYTTLPEPVDMTRLVVTHDVEPAVPDPQPVWVTPDLADMARTGAIGGIA